MDARKAWLRLGIYILLLAAAATARHFLFPDTGPEDARQVTHEAGPWAHVVLLAAFVALGTLYLPMGWLMVVSGAAFGLPWALVWSYGGVVAASLLAYFLAGQVQGRPRRWLQRRIPDAFKRLDKGVGALTAVRVIPILPNNLFNAASGIQRVPPRNFAIAVAVGDIPGVLAYTMLGTVIGGLRLDDPSRWPWSLAAAVGAVALFIGLGAWVGHRRGTFD